MKHIHILVVAASAVLIAAGAHGQTGPVPPIVKPGDKIVPAAPKTTGGANLGTAQMYAHFDGDGIMDPETSKGTVPCPGGTCKVATGQYEVHFQRDISECAVVASLGARGAYYVSAGSGVTASTGANLPTAVRVATNDGSVLTDRRFYIIVMC